MTVVADLTTARENYAARLAAISALTEDKPSYSVDGRSISWTEYQAFLVDKIEHLTKQIQALQGAIEIQTIAHG